LSWSEYKKKGLDNVS